MRPPAILLLALLPFCGCEIFLENLGGEGAPCDTTEDCRHGLTCDLDENRCVEPLIFGRECQSPQDCGDVVFGDCIFFPKEGKSFCTRHCGDAADCGELGARCAFTDPIILEAFCAHPSWTQDEFGCMCNDAGVGCTSGPCVEFVGFSGKQICGKNCPDCPPGAECGMASQAYPEMCGYPTWFGFGAPCSIDSNCSDQFPMYPVCHEASSCTRTCSNMEPCSGGLECKPAGSGVCVPKP